MSEQAPKLPRKPFGYDTMAVDRMLSERDSMLGLADRRVREAEARAAQLEEQLRTRENAVEELRAKLAAVPPQPATVEEPQPEPEPEPEPLSPKFMTEELSKIVLAAEASTSQILERAWTSTRDQILEADSLWREIQAEVVRFAGWREEAEAVVGALQASLDDARDQLEAMPRRLQDAVGAAVDAIQRVDAGVSSFLQASTLPLLLTPAGLERARARASEMSGSVEEFESSFGPADMDAVDIPNGHDADMDTDPQPPGIATTGPWSMEALVGVDPQDLEAAAGQEEPPGHAGDPVSFATEASDELREVQGGIEDADTGTYGAGVWGA